MNINKGNKKRLVGKRPNESSGIRENLINPKLLLVNVKRKATSKVGGASKRRKQ